MLQIIKCVTQNHCHEYVARLGGHGVTKNIPQMFLTCQIFPNSWFLFTPFFVQNSLCVSTFCVCLTKNILQMFITHQPQIRNSLHPFLYRTLCVWDVSKPRQDLAYLFCFYITETYLIRKNIPDYLFKKHFILIIKVKYKHMNEIYTLISGAILNIFEL